jgi:chaperonin GroES
VLKLGRAECQSGGRGPPAVRARRGRAHAGGGIRGAATRAGVAGIPQRHVLFLRRQSMNVRPLRDRILVKRIEEEEQKVGGIIIPDTAKEKPQQGKVVAVGNGRVNDEGKVLPLDVKAGDTILFGKYAGTEIKIEGQEYLILREDEVLGVVEGVREMATV